jgi:hypothetical protein
MDRNNEDVAFDAPIPGMSLTAEFGARPWQSPPQIASVDDAIEYYLERMSNDDFNDQLLDVMEMGVPVADVANTLQLGAVMEGVHTIDVGILVMPLLAEMMMLIGDSAGVKYESGLEDNPDKDRVRRSLVEKTLRKLENMDSVKKNDETPDEEEQETEEPSTGLMARRQ